MAVGLLCCLPSSIVYAGGYDYDLYGEWRYIFSHTQDFPLNSTDQASGLNLYIDQRLDIGTRQYVTDDLEFTAELEIFYGQVTGDLDHVGAEFRTDARETLRGWDFKKFDLRQLWLRYDAPWFQIRAGQMYSYWGMGMLANDGRPTPRRFGFPDQGDVSDRLVLATRPFSMFDGWPSKIILAVASGVVYLDENCSLRDGDIGVEAIGSLVYRDDGIDIGIYVAGRIQDDEAGSELNVAAIDFFAKIDAGQGYSGPMIALEMAYLTGNTSRVIHADHINGVDISAFGAVLQAGWRFDFHDFLPAVEVGYASGDPDPHDGTVTSFSFDPDFNVGLILFDTVLRGISAMSAQESADPDRIGEPLPGTDMLATNGRINGTVYINPTISIKPLEQLTILTGFLYAWSSTPFAQSYQTFKNGGVATNPYGLTNPGRELGMEFDLGINWDQEIWGNLHITAGFQAGWFFPGSAFNRPDGSRHGMITRLLGMAAVYW